MSDNQGKQPEEQAPCSGPTPSAYTRVSSPLFHWRKASRQGYVIGGCHPPAPQPAPEQPPAEGPTPATDETPATPTLALLDTQRAEPSIRTIQTSTSLT